MPWYGVTTYGALTWALPKPVVVASMPASSPMTAIECVADVIGSTLGVLQQHRALLGDLLRDVAVCAAEVTSVASVPVCVLSNSPAANIEVRMRRTAVVDRRHGDRGRC